MRRLIALILVLGGILWMLPGSSVAARAPSDSGDFGAARTIAPVSYAGGEGLILTKASCTSDSGDTCTCGAGALCVSGAEGCACIRPRQQ